jgi:hypothetical protein
MYSMQVTLVLVVGGLSQNGFMITMRIIKRRLPDIVGTAEQPLI